MSDVKITNGMQPVPDPSLKNVDDRKKKIEEQKLKKACADFESLFVYNLFQTMRKTIPKGDASMQSFGKETYNMMFDQKIAEELSHTGGGGMGLQKILYNQLKRPHNE